MKKIIFGVLISGMLLINSSFAYTKIYDMKSSEKPISSGVTYKNLKRLTTTGWLNINILKVDLTDKYAKVGMMTSKDGLYNLKTVKDQANENNAVAAINADFFSWDGTGLGYPIGFTMKDGEVISSAYYKNATSDTMATFLLDSKNSPLYKYMKMESAKISNSNGESIDVAEINKISGDYLTPVVFTPEFNTTSPGNSKLWDMVEFVVEDGKLKEIRDCMEGATIPKNGYVICARLDNAYKIRCMFNIGDKVNLDIKANVDLDKMITAISGGGMLIENGKVNTEFTHDISGYQPRTAIGTSSDGKTLYMVTVDGRGISKGATQVELAYLMYEIGCHNAINLDGGGSTAMVGRLPGTDYLSTLNVITENRKVVDILGIISTAPKGSIDELIVSSDRNTIFKNYTAKLTVTGYDEYINPVTVPQDDVKWKVSGVKGTVENGIFKPTTDGIATLTATYKGVSNTIEIRVLGDIAEIVTDSREISLAKGQEYKIPITVKDVEGYTAVYNATDLDYITSNDNCSVDENGVITAKKHGSTLVTILAGRTAKGFIKVNITGSYDKDLDDFEKLNATFRGYPSDSVSGKVKLASKNYEGNKSLHLSYDFTRTDATRGAYAVFDAPITIEENAIKLGVWAYSKKAQNNVMLKMQIVDANDESKLVELSKELKKDWNEYELDLTNIALPAKLERIYVAQVLGKKGVDSSIYLDKLYVTFKSDASNSNIILPNNTKATDLTNVEADLGKNGFRFLFCGNATNSGTLYDLIRSEKLNEKAKEAEFAILGSGQLENVEEQIVLNGKYSFYEKDKLAVIKLANNGKGLLATHTDQWNWFVTKLSETKAKNLMIVMPDEVENSFSDAQEKKLFKEVLQEYEEKNNATVTFLVLGEESTFSMYEGTKTIFAGTRKYDNVRSNVYGDNYVMFTVNGDKLTYQILNIFE